MKAVVIVQDKERLSQEQINSAFSGVPDVLWYKALKQIALDDMNNSVLSAARYAAEEKTLAMGSDFGGYAAISGLLARIERIASNTQDQTE